MKKTSYRLAIIFTLAYLTLFVNLVDGKCIDECAQKCNTTIDEKYRWGEGVPMNSIDSTDYLIQKNREKTVCIGKCEDECSQKTKKNPVTTESALEKEPKK